MDELRVAQLPRDKPLNVTLGPRRKTSCAISGCPLDEHAYVVRLPQGAGLACTGCAEDRGFEFDWSRV